MVLNIDRTYEMRLGVYSQHWNWAEQRHWWCLQAGQPCCPDMWTITYVLQNDIFLKCSLVI
jgi:hypothetical protein